VEQDNEITVVKSVRLVNLANVSDQVWSLDVLMAATSQWLAQHTEI